MFVSIGRRLNGRRGRRSGALRLGLLFVGLEFLDSLLIFLPFFFEISNLLGLTFPALGSADAWGAIFGGREVSETLCVCPGLERAVSPGTGAVAVLSFRVEPEGVKGRFLKLRQLRAVRAAAVPRSRAERGYRGEAAISSTRRFSMCHSPMQCPGGVLLKCTCSQQCFEPTVDSKGAGARYQHTGTWPDRQGRTFFATRRYRSPATRSDARARSEKGPHTATEPNTNQGRHARQPVLDRGSVVWENGVNPAPQENK